MNLETDNYLEKIIPISSSGLPQIKPLPVLANKIAEPLERLTEFEKKKYIEYMWKIYKNFYHINKNKKPSKTLYEILGDETVLLNYRDNNNQLLNNHIQTNIGKTFDTELIKCILLDFLSFPTNNVLIVDFENINSLTKKKVVNPPEIKIQDYEYTSDNPPSEKGNILIDDLKKSAYLILNYAVTVNPNFTNIIIICKSSENREIFENQIEEIVKKGKITYDAAIPNNSKPDYIFRQQINCKHIQERIQARSLKCILLHCQVPNITSDNGEFEDELHRLKGGDDATQILLVSLLVRIKESMLGKNDYINEIRILSRDTKMLEDYNKDWEYILPFNTDIIEYIPESDNNINIKNLENSYIFNFSLAQVISDNILNLSNADFNSTYVENPTDKTKNFYNNYYFQPGTITQEQNNWFLRTNEKTDKGVPIIRTFIGYSGDGKFDLPYSDENGNVLLDNNNMQFMHTYENKKKKLLVTRPLGILVKGATQTKDYALEKKTGKNIKIEPLKIKNTLGQLELVRDENNEIVTIAIQTSPYYEKYLKYKEKYLALKKLLNQ